MGADAMQQIAEGLQDVAFLCDEQRQVSFRISVFS